MGEEGGRETIGARERQGTTVDKGESKGQGHGQAAAGREEPGRKQKPRSAAGSLPATEVSVLDFGTCNPVLVPRGPPCANRGVHLQGPST